MTPNLYRVEIPMRLAVEANSRQEAIRLMRALWREVSNDLPTGAGVFVDDDVASAHLKANVKIS